MDHRLFTIHILPGEQCFDAYLLVPVVRCADDDRVDIRPFQDFPVIPGDEDLIAPQFLCFVDSSLIQIADGRNGDPLERKGRLHVDDSHSSCSNQRHVGRFLGGGKGISLHAVQECLLRGRCQKGGCSERGRGKAGHFQKRTSVVHFNLVSSSCAANEGEITCLLFLNLLQLIDSFHSVLLV